jgi:hypothetical protein
MKPTILKTEDMILCCLSHVETESNTSTVNLRFVGDDKGTQCLGV